MEQTTMHRQAYLYLFLSLILALFSFPSTSYADGGFPIIGVLHAGRRPEGIAVDAQTHMVYIAYESHSMVVGFDPITGKVRWRRTTGDVTADIQVDSITHRVYVASFSFQKKQALLIVLDGVTGKTLLTAAVHTTPDFGDNGLAVDTKRGRVYVSSSSDGVITVLTLITAPGTGDLTAEASFISVGPHPQALGVNSRLGRLYVADAAQHRVTVLDEDSGRKLATISVADVPVPPLRVDEATGRVYVVCSIGQELDVIDGNTNSILARIPVTPYPEGVAFNTATGRIYVADEGNKDNSFSNESTGTTITIIDSQSLDVLGTLSVGRAPDGVEADPALRRVYVSVEDSDAVVEISDSVDIPLQSGKTLHQVAAVHQAVFLLQQATVITLIVMILTMVGATLSALSPRWRARRSSR